MSAVGAVGGMVINRVEVDDSVALGVHVCMDIAVVEASEDASGCSTVSAAW